MSVRRLQEPLDRYRSELLERRFRTLQAKQLLQSDAPRLLGREGPQIAGRRTALRDGPMEEASGKGRSHQVENVRGAARRARDGHATGVATEGGYVSLHPLERSDLIEKAVVARGAIRRFPGQGRMGEKAEQAEPVVEGDDHDAAAS